MQLSSSSSFVDRVIGAIRFAPATYESVETVFGISIVAVNSLASRPA